MLPFALILPRVQAVQGELLDVAVSCVAGGVNHSAAISEDGTLFCWGALDIGSV